MSFIKALGFPVLGILLAVADSVAAADVVIIVSANNPATTLSRNDVSNIFLGKTNRFPNGAQAVPIDQPEGSTQRLEFYRDISDKQPAEIRAHWSKMIFTGRGQPPKVASDDEQVKNTLASQPGGIGYIDPAAVDARVKPLTVQ